MPHSPVYHEPMQRFVTLIVVIFTFAALAGPAMAHAHRYVSTPIVVLNHVDSDNVSLPVIVEVQNYNVDLGSGIVMPCGPYFAIPVETSTLPVTAAGEIRTRLQDDREPTWLGVRPLRPPRRV